MVKTAWPSDSRLQSYNTLNFVQFILAHPVDECACAILLKKTQTYGVKVKQLKQLNMC